MKGLLIIVYTVISGYFMLGTFILPLYILSMIKPLRRPCNNLIKYTMGLCMSNVSCFYHEMLNIPLYLYGDKINKDESALFLMNHRSSIDYLFFISLISKYGDPEKIKIVMKSILRFFPGLGWGCYLDDFPFLKRDYSSDKEYLNNLGRKLNDSNLLIFPEGTRYSLEKAISSNNFSKSKGYPQYKNVLLPKTKGSYLIFKTMLENKNIDAIYDLTINFDGIEKYTKHNTLSLIFKNDIKSVHIHCRRISLLHIPRNEDGFRQWMHQLFIGKDILLETPIKMWKNVYPVHTIKKKKNKIIFKLTLILCICFIFLLIKSSSFGVYHIILLIIGTYIVFRDDKYNLIVTNTRKPIINRMVNKSIVKNYSI